MQAMNDKLFLAIARKTGFPSPEAIARLRAEHPGRSLHEVAVASGALAGNERAQLEKIGARFARGDRSVLEPSGSGADTKAPGRKRRALRQSSMTVATLPGAGDAHVPTARLSDPKPTPSAGRVPSAPRPGTPSAGRVPAAAKSGTPSAPRVEAKAHPPASPTPSGAAKAPAHHPPASATPSGAAKAPAHHPPASGTPSGGTRTASGSRTKRSGLAQPSGSRAPQATRDEASLQRLYLAGAILVVVGAIVVAIALVVVQPERQVVSASPTPAPAASATPQAELTPASPSSREKAAHTSREAEQLELEGRESEALALLDQAIETAPPDGPTRGTLADARGHMVARLHARLGEVVALADAGSPTRARRLLASLRGRYPDALRSDVEDVAKRFEAQSAAPSPPPRPSSGPSGPGSDELARLKKIHRWTTRTLAGFDVGAAQKFFAGIHEIEDPQLAAGIALDRQRIEAVSQLGTLANAGFSRSVGQTISLELRGAAPVRVKLLSAEGTSLTVEGGRRAISFGLLTPSSVCAAAEAGGGEAGVLALGEGVFLACTGDRDAALTRLASAPNASTLARAIEEDDDFVGAPVAGALVTAPSPSPRPVAQPAETPAPVEPSPEPAVVLRPPRAVPSPQPTDLKPLTKEERKAAVEEARKKGPWKLAFMSKYYDFYSNGNADDVLALATSMDLMCDEYKRIFAYKQPIARPFPIVLYANQAEFMAATHESRGVGGFYDGERIVAFHGGLGTLTTESVLFHEGTHQFEGLVLGENMWKARTWFIEGLAVYFESSQVQGKHLTTDVIPIERLHNVQRSLKTPDMVHLRDLIRTEQADYSALHYAYGWSLIYYLTHGTKGGLERFKKYFEGIKAGKDSDKLFEELFDKPIDEIEAYWKDWIINLH